MMRAKILPVCCFGYGLFAVISRQIVMLAVEDIVAGTYIPSSVLLTVFAITDTFGKLLSPFIVRKISMLPSIVLVCSIWLTSYTLIVIPNSVEARLVGVAFLGAGNALAVIIMCLIIPLYEDHVEANTSAFQVGGNTSSLFGTLLYTGLTTWLYVAPRISLAICYPLVFLSVIFYAFLNHGSLKQHQSEKQQEQNEYQYSTISSTIDHKPKTTLLQKTIYYLELLLKVFPFFNYFFLIFFSYYISGFAILTTLTFPSSPFRARDHYQYYRLCNDVGMFLGGMEMMLVMCLFPDWLNLFRIRKLWILVMLNISHMMIFLFSSWYHFVSNVYVVLLLCLTHGIVFGSTNVRVLTSTADCFARSRDKGSALSIVEVGSSLGRLAVGLMGLFVETYLRKHCINRLLLGRFCLARFESSAGWNENPQ